MFHLKTMLSSTALGMVCAAFAAKAATVNSLDFSMTENESQLTLSADAPVKFTQSVDGTEYVLDLEAKLAPFASRKLDTSSFKGSSVVSVTPSQDAAAGRSQVRVKLREAGVVPQFTQEGSKIHVYFPNSAIAEPGALVGADPADSLPKEQTKSDLRKKDALGSREVQTIDEGAAKDAAIAANDPAARAIDRALQAQGTQSFTGKPITIQVREMEIKEVLRMIGEASGFNIVIGDGVTGKMNLNLVDVPWDQALDIVLRGQKLGADRRYNVLRVMPMTRLTEEKKEEQKNKALGRLLQPRITKIYPISYADTNQLQTIARQFLQSAAAEAADGGTAVPPTIQVDIRTNSLIIQDYQENIDKVTKLISLLDTQTPQVMIEARIVEARESFTKGLTGQLGIGPTTSDPSFLTSFNGGNPTTSLAVGDPPSQGEFGLKPRLGFLPGNAALTAFLKVQETQDHAKIVSSPRVVVLNKESANIIQGIPILIPVTVNTGLNGTTQGVALDSVNISLNVTPQVTNDGSVIMNLNVQRDAAQPMSGGLTGKSNRSIQTKVLVDSGSTLVIGGIYTSDVSESESGFPFLRKIPILGWLFGSQSNTTTRSELFIFVTPRILNSDRSSIASANSG